MPLDPQVLWVLDRIRDAGNPEYWQMTPEQARDWHNRKAGILDVQPEPVFKAEDRVIPGPAADIAVRVYTPRASRTPLPVLVWLHGGGHVVGNIDSYDALCRQLALQADCLVVSVEYRLAPEHKFPAGVEDGFAALTWVGHHAVEIGGDPERIAIGGDSGGGNLAAVCVILARDAGFPKLAFQLLVYPRTAAWEDSASHREFAEGYLLTRKTILCFHNHCLNSDEDRKDWRWAPLDCPDLSRLPPALVIVGEYDPLRDEGIAYAERMRREGNTVELTNYAGMVHPFFSMGGAIDAGRRAIAQAARALKQAFRSA
ncbi:MAG: alpha/beta hydrolase [Vicinamibacterales bacterium]